MWEYLYATAFALGLAWWFYCMVRDVMRPSLFNDPAFLKDWTEMQIKLNEIAASSDVASNDIGVDDAG